MKNDSTSGGAGKLGKKIVQSIKGSVIISGLDKICVTVYEKLCTGAFARLFGARVDDTQNSEKTSQSEKCKTKPRIFAGISTKIENSVIVTSVNRCASGLLGLRLRVIGTYLLTFAAYTAALALIAAVLKGTVASGYDALNRIVSAAVIALAAIPFCISKRTLSGALTSSRIFLFVVKLLGFGTNKLWSDEIRGKHLSAFILGTVSGVMTVVVEPMIVFALIAALLFVYLVFSFPEFGVVTAAFVMPFIPTMVLAGLTILIALSFFFKLIRGKRVLSFERIDFFVAVFAVMLILAGVVSMSTGSLAPAFLFVCFISIYFMVSCLVRSAEWLRKIITATVTSAAIVAAYGILQYAFGAFGAETWLDAELFAGIAGRAVSTLENPNMLGEYLVMIIPIAAALFLAKGEKAKKYFFVCLGAMGVCLILTWSRGAWLGFIFAAVIFFLVWSKRSMWVFAGGILSLPLLPIILPDSIITRFTSIGNVADTSTSYRVSIWRAAMKMLRDNLFNGIGIGEKAWGEIYPDYSLPGIEAAPHSHNLYIQIALEQGIFGLIVFFVILFLMLYISFSLFARLSKNTSLVSSDSAFNTRMLIAGPICGLAGVLVQGLTDYSWYNYRVYFMFWLVLALVPALVKQKRREIDVSDPNSLLCTDSNDTAAVDITLDGNGGQA